MSLIQDVAVVPNEAVAINLVAFIRKSNLRDVLHLKIKLAVSLHRRPGKPGIYGIVLQINAIQKKRLNSSSN